jgi:hypothetical protein
MPLSRFTAAPRPFLRVLRDSTDAVFDHYRHGRRCEQISGPKGTVGRQNGVAGFDQYTEIKSVGYPAG